MARAGAGVFVILGCLTVSVFGHAQASSAAGTTTFVLDGNRIYAELGFLRPDGSLRRALAFVDMGSASMMLTEALSKDLRLDRGQALEFKVGEFTVSVPPAELSGERRERRSIGADRQVEAMLPASVLQRYEVVIDYQQRTLTLAQPGTIKPEGIVVPFHLDEQTGLIAVDASIDGGTYPVTLDNGSAYSWFRQTTAKKWLLSHPEWARGVGAVGASNMMMSGDGTETAGTLLRIPEISLGSLTLQDVGALAAGPGRTFSGNLDLFDWYSKKNALPVIGWIGGNVLKGYRLTIDYPSRTIYWLKESDPDSHDLDQIGLTLRFEAGAYFVAAIATKDGRPTVEGVLPGDQLIRVGDLDTKQASWGAIYNAMHGKPGEARTLILERSGNRVTVTATVTAF